ncbi:hypothetical protein [Amycolatopsis sp. 195334CR]|uniref:hypothetical protein n=1 Tax=Amycolatopsis sp. 195334CR TaxID=2814588 RepID=UPI001A8CBA04|nr:hypothetical protein [Amycolatopsis sp. 195334CR]MBN6040263.1 hypothetical protein [Amycolatopsis sp. 195334CR]
MTVNRRTFGKAVAAGVAVTAAWRVPAASAASRNIGGLGCVLDASGRLVFLASVYDRMSSFLVYGRQRTPGLGPWDVTPIEYGTNGRTVALLDHQGRTAYFVRGNQGELWFGRQQPDGTWTKTVAVTQVLEICSAALGPDGRIRFLVQRGAGQLLSGVETAPGSGEFTTTTVLDGGVGAARLLVDSGGGARYLATRSDGTLWHGRQFGEVWQSEVVATGVEYPGSIAVVADASARLRFVLGSVTGPGKFGYQTGFDWVLGDLGLPSRSPLMALDVAGRLVHLASTPDDQLFWARKATAEEPAWTSAAIRPGVQFGLDTALDVNGKLCYFASGYGEVVHGWEKTPGGGDWDSTTIQLP